MYRKFALIGLVLLLAGSAWGQIDPNASSFFVRGPTSCMMNCPAGDGQNLSSATSGGAFWIVFDVNGNFVSGLSYKDFEIDSSTPFAVSDAFYPGVPQWDIGPNTFMETFPGTYFYIGPLFAGGADNTQIIGKCQGVALNSSTSASLVMVSPDFNGDGAIDLNDVVRFAGIFFSGVYDYRGDLNCDGLVNLLDVTVLAQHLGHTLPSGAIVDPVD